jgi:hypothetical protein
MLYLLNSKWGMTWLRNGELWVATLRGIYIFRDSVFAGHLSSREEHAIPESVNAVLELSDDDVWAAGGDVDRSVDAGRTLIEHWDGTSWSVVESANKGPSDNYLVGISAAGGRMLAVGERFKGGGTGPVVPLSLERCGP